jgi:uncharacterized membrane protein
MERKGLTVHSRVLCGVGIFILYAAALALANLRDASGDLRLAYGFANGVTVTIIAMLIAVRLNSAGIVLIAALGGYLTPLLTWHPGTTVAGDVVVHVYVAMLNVALTGSAFVRRWEFVRLVAWTMTVCVLAYWIAMSSWEVSRPEAKWIWVMHAAVFATMLAVPHLWLRKPSRQVGNALVACTWFGFAAGYGWLCAFDPVEMAWLTAIVATINSIVAWQGFRRLEVSDRLARVSLALASVFATLSITIWLRDYPESWTTVWAVEGVMFAWAGFAFRDRQLLLTALAAFALALSWLAAETPPADLAGWGSDPPRIAAIAVRWLLQAACLAAAGSGLAWLPRIVRPADSESGKQDIARVTGTQEDKLVTGLLLGVSNLALMVTIWLLLVPRTDWILSAWTLQAAALLLVGFSTGRRELQYFAATLLIVPAGWLAMAVAAADWMDITRYDVSSRGAMLFLAACWFAAGIGFREGARSGNANAQGLHVLTIVAGHIALLFLLTAEIHFRFASSGRPLFGQAEMAAWSVGWGTYAALAIAAGIGWRMRVNRVFGMVLFPVVLLKVFLIDLANFELIIRVVALFALGMLLLGVSWLYHRYRSRIAI